MSSYLYIEKRRDSSSSSLVNKAKGSSERRVQGIVIISLSEMGVILLQYLNTIVFGIENEVWH